eukprot:scaffold109_cov252-Pinguiococcus_pyrenoidosus.AAC.67
MARLSREDSMSMDEEERDDALPPRPRFRRAPTKMSLPRKQDSDEVDWRRLAEGTWNPALGAVYMLKAKREDLMKRSVGGEALTRKWGSCNGALACPRSAIRPDSEGRSTPTGGDIWTPL